MTLLRLLCTYVVIMVTAGCSSPSTAVEAPNIYLVQTSPKPGGSAGLSAKGSWIDMSDVCGFYVVSKQIYLVLCAEPAPVVAVLQGIEIERGDERLVLGTLAEAAKCRWYVRAVDPLLTEDGFICVSVGYHDGKATVNLVGELEEALNDGR